ncbi:hypothetical protein ILUMI_14688, partial [Ignelater luminosus]
RETKYLLNGTPGRSWFQGFLKYSESVRTQNKIEAWFDEISGFLQAKNYESILKDKSQVFNADEAGCCLCPKSRKVLGPEKIKKIFL